MAKRKRTSTTPAIGKRERTSTEMIVPILTFPREILLMIAKLVGEPTSNNEVQWQESREKGAAHSLFAFRLTNTLFADIGAEAAMLLSRHGIPTPFSELKFALRPLVLDRFQRISNHKYLSRALRTINVCVRTFDLINILENIFVSYFAVQYETDFNEAGSIHETMNTDCLAGRIVTRRLARVKADYKHYRSRLETQRRMLDELRRNLFTSLVNPLKKLTGVKTLRFLRNITKKSRGGPELSLGDGGCLAFYEPFNVVYKALGLAGQPVSTLQLLGVDPYFINTSLLASTSLGDVVLLSSLTSLQIRFKSSLWQHIDLNWDRMDDPGKSWATIIDNAVNLEKLSIEYRDIPANYDFGKLIVQSFKLKRLHSISIDNFLCRENSFVEMLERHAESLRELRIIQLFFASRKAWRWLFPRLKRNLRLESCSIVHSYTAREKRVLEQVTGADLGTAVDDLFSDMFRCDIGPYLVHKTAMAAD